MKNPSYLKNVATLTLDRVKCDACGICLQVCPHGVFAIRNKKAEIIDIDRCMECGACALNCHRQAIGVLSGMGCGCATGIIEGYFKNGTSSGDCNCC